MAIKIFRVRDYEFHVCDDQTLTDYAEGFADESIHNDMESADEWIDWLIKTRDSRVFKPH